MARDVKSEQMLLKYAIKVFDATKERPKIILDRIKEKEMFWLDYTKATGLKD